jgi:hypothetical protein
MARFKTRAQLREHAQRLAHRKGNAGAYVTEDWNRALQEAWDFVWYRLTRGIDWYGLRRVTWTIQNGDPNGRIPGSTLALPADFLDLRTIARSASGAEFERPNSTTPDQIEELGLVDASGAPLTTLGYPGHYLIEGPAQFTDDLGVVQTIVQRILFFPPLVHGDRIRVSYITQAPTLGDPANDALDSTQVDVIAEPIETAVVAMARTVASSREEPNEYHRARAEAQEAVTAFRKEQPSRRNQDAVNSIDKFQRGPWGTGY